MERVPEAEEVMNDPASVDAYAQADFEEVNSQFVGEVVKTLGLHLGLVADIGCGPADIAVRLAGLMPKNTIIGVDASAEMLSHGRQLVDSTGFSNVKLVQGYIPGLPFRAVFDTIVSNATVHQLPSARAFWEEIVRIARFRTSIYVKDLLRPASPDDARSIVDAYAANEPEVHREDFFNSLCAAFTIDEVRQHLEEAGLGNYLTVRQVSDRHWVVSGRF